ncbi:MAG: hypothetical protein HY842_04070 [Bacteroidetes bacterium]|nr:hypothetical protein [Bacteroidota bacterium]
MNPEIKVVSTRSALQHFIKFPFKLYQNHPYWIPPLLQSELALLQPETNPAFKHSAVVLLSAWYDGEMVGRIAGIINEREAASIGEKHARFGWFDFIDDKSVSAALLGRVENWAREKNCTVLKGPYGFNQLDKNGMLIEGFQELGTINTLYNHEYYPLHLAALGFEKELEWVEMQAEMPLKMSEKISNAAELVKQRYNLKIHQPKSKSEMHRLGYIFFEMLHETYCHLPGFVPISDLQRDAYVANYMSFLPPEFVCMVMTADNEPIGFGLTMPSMSRAMQHANGHLFPFGIFHLMKARIWNDWGDLSLLGVKEAWRKRGVHGVIFNEIGNTFIQKGIKHIRINPMLENNQNVLTLWKEFDHRVYKRRRTFSKKI